MVTAVVEDRHPLSQVLVRKGWTAEDYLRRVADQHRALGYGQLCYRREKLSRWTRTVRPQVPNECTQLAMAAVLGISASEVRVRAWPQWLLLGMRDDDAVWESPWTPAGTIHALDDPEGALVDRRGFLATGAGTVSAVIAQWASAAPAPARTTGGGQQIGTAVADRLDSRLDDLRHLDDELGADHVYDAALAEKRLITRLLRDHTYTPATERRLYSSAAEASRLAGWCAYDLGDVVVAERHFVAALRAAASADDYTTGAIIAAFWANARYGSTTPDPRSALHLIDTALRHRSRITSPRALALLHIRRARAHSLAGESADAYRAIDDAMTAYIDGVPAGDELPSVYWVNAGEIHQAAASAALSLHDPAKALYHFRAATTDHDAHGVEQEARGAAIYLFRQSSAHLELGEPDAAVETAEHAVDLIGGVSSARATNTLAELRADLARHRRTPVVRDFLDKTA